tara:strand:+ start:2411 stop:3448 length:1038 start_codon:yes stop_codon:yes gene_type:complete
MHDNQWYRKEHPLLSLLGMGGGAGSPATTSSGPDAPDSGITATGGTITTIKNHNGLNWKVHTFNSSGTFAVSAVSAPTDSPTAVQGKVEYLVIGGGGSGPNANGGGAGGGGAGGYRANVGQISPAPEPSGGTGSTEPAYPVSVTNYSITVGAGGAYSDSNHANSGSPSVFDNITSTGGGYGNCSDPGGGGDGGSGGGGGEFNGDRAVKGEGTANQGYDGGSGTGESTHAGGGGGGAAAAGGNGDSSNGSISARYGGTGRASSISGSPVFRAGGGGASGNDRAGGNGGNGGGGNGGGGSGGPGDSPGGLSSGTANTGGGGGARYVSPTLQAAGGSGVVIIRYVYNG